MNTEPMTKIIYPLIQEIVQIPIYIYTNDSVTNCYPDQSPLTYPPQKYMKEICSHLIGSDHATMIYTTEYETWYAGIQLMNEDDVFLILGPVNSVSYHEQIYLRMFLDYVVMNEHKEDFRSFMKQIPTMDLYHFSRKIQLIHYICNKEVHDEALDLISLKQSLSSESQTQESCAKIKVNVNPCYSMNTENILFSHVRLGNVGALKNFISNPPSYQNGEMAKNTLRQEKNSSIITTALACRAAIEGGLTEETAFQLSDHYIQLIESSEDLKQLFTLLKEMLIDYTTRVEAQSSSLTDDYLIQRCLNYIRANVDHKITTQDIADHVGYTRSYISTKFKHVMGFDLSSYIIRCKLEKSRIMLKHTDNTINEISHSLSFANQSHFNTHFKRQYKMTPFEYRHTQ